MPDRTTFRHNLAYGAYMVCGLVALVVSSLSLVPMDERMATVLGLVLVLPLFMVALFAMATGLVFSILLRDDRMVLGLGIVSAVLLALLSADVMSPGFYNAAGWAYGLGVPLVCMHWFTFGRRFHARAQAEADARMAAEAEAAELAEAEGDAAEVARAEEAAVRERLQQEHPEDEPR